MADVFISYSRKDSAFVRVLHDSLKQQQRDSWVDWEDIPLTAAWWEEICRGIETADTFIFVISPDSVASKVCSDEIAHAVKTHKRLVPVVRREVADYNAIHSALQAHNWLYFRENDDFAKAFVDLTKAIDTDLDYVRAHTRLLVRAIEWEKSGGNASYHLRGVDLQQAETWLLGSGEKQPRPADAHGRYIAASRQAANARQRLTLAGVVAALAISIGLALLAFVQYRTAEGQRMVAVANAATAVAAESTAVAALAVAERNALEAQSLLLASSARQALNEHNEDLALALAVEANRLERPPSQAQAALSSIAFQPGPRRVYSVPDAIYSANAVAYSPALNRVAGAGSGVMVWDAESGELVQWLNDAQERALDAAFSPDARWLAASSEGGAVYIWDTETWIMAQRYFLGEPVNAVAFSPDGRTLLAATGAIRGGHKNEIVLWQVESGAEVRRLQGHADGVLDAAFSPDGQTILSASADYTMMLWDAETGEVVRQFGSEEQTWYFRLAFSPDGAAVLAAMDYGALALWDVNSGEIVRRFEGHTGRIAGIALSPDGQRALSTSVDIYGGYDTTLRMWDVETGAELLRFGGYPLNPSSEDILFTPDGQRAFSATGTEVRLWDLTTSMELWRASIPSSAQFTSTNSVDFSPDGRTALTASDDGQAYLWDVASGQLTRAFPGFYARFGRDGRSVLASAAGGLAVHDVETGDVIRRMRGIEGRLYDLALSLDGRYALTGGDAGVAILWDLERGEAVQRLEGYGGAIYALALHPDGTMALAGGALGTFMLWDLDSGEMTREFPGHENGIFSLAFSPDGALAFSGSGNKGGGGDYSIRVWDVANGQQVRQLLGHEMTVHDLQVSPDGARLLSSSGDDTVRLWDVATGQEIERFAGHSDHVSAVAFSPDGQSALSAGGSTLIRWRVQPNPQTLLAWALANRYVRDLTCEERQRFNAAPCPPMQAGGG